MPTTDYLAPDEFADLLDTPEFKRMRPAERAAVFDAGLKDSEAWLRENNALNPQDWQQTALALGNRYRPAEADIELDQQGPVGTAVNAFRNLGPEVVHGVVGGIAKMADAGAEMVGLSDPAQPSWMDKTADFTERLVDEGQLIRPTNPANPYAATIGSGMGQVVTMLGTAGAAVPIMGAARAMTAVPAAMGYTMGAGQGVDTAEEMGITSPAARLGMGTAFGAFSGLTEGIGSIGGKLIPTPKGLAGMALAPVMEAGEEVLDQAAQDATTAGVGQFMSDPNRPGFTPSGYKLPAFDADMLERQKQAAIGGAAGGTVFAGVQALAQRNNPNDNVSPNQTPAQAGTPQGTGTTPTPAPLGGLAGQPGLEEDTGELTAAEVADLDRAPAPAFTDSGVGQTMSDPQADVMRDFGIRQPVTPRDDSLMEAPQVAGDVITDLRIPRSPAAIAESQRIENERLAQQAGLRNQQAKAGRGPVIPDSPLGVYDILDFVNENRIRLPKAGETNEGGQNDWAEQFSVPQYYRQFLGNTERGGSIDQVAQMAFENGFIQEPTPDALMGAVQQGIATRKQYRVEIVKQQRQQMKQADRAMDFEKTQGTLRSKDQERVAFDQLATGDQLKIDGENVQVQQVQYDDDGYLTNVVLEDGKRFGVMQFDPQTRGGIFVDAFTPNPSSGFKNLDTSGTTAGFLNTDIINEAVDLIRQGITDFANWSRAMLTRFGRGIAEYLRGVWQAAMRTSQVGAVGDVRGGAPGAASNVRMASDSGAAKFPKASARRLQQSRDAIEENGLFDQDGEPIALNDDGTVTLYHRTTLEAAVKIRQSGKFLTKENTGESFFSSSRDGDAASYGSEVIEVRVFPEDVRLDDQVGNEIHVAVSNRKLSTRNLVPSLTPSRAAGGTPRPMSEAAARAKANYKAGQQPPRPQAAAQPPQPAPAPNQPRPQPGKAFEMTNDIADPRLRLNVRNGQAVWDQLWGPLKKAVRFVSGTGKEGEHGLFTPTDGLEDLIEINRHPHEDEDAITTVHELAHAQDSTGLHTMASEDPTPGTPMAKLMELLNTKLPTAKALNRAAASWAALPDKDARDRKVAKHLKYLAQPDERFARAVEQVTRWKSQGRILSGKGGYYESGYLTLEEMQTILPLLHDILGHGTHSTQFSTAQNQPGGPPASAAPSQLRTAGRAYGEATGNDGGGTGRVSRQSASPVDDGTRQTRSTFASPDAAQNGYQEQTTEQLRAESAAWLDANSLDAALNALETNTPPPGLRIDHIPSLGSALILRLTKLTETGTETQRLMANALLDRAGNAWYGAASQEAGRTLQQRHMANQELGSIEGILAAKQVLVRQAQKVLDKRFEGGTEGATAKVTEVIKKAEAQAGEELAAKLGDDPTDDVPELGENPEVASSDAQVKALEQQLERQRGEFSQRTALWQKILATLNQATSGKKALLRKTAGMADRIRKAAQARLAARNTGGTQRQSASVGAANAAANDVFDDQAAIGMGLIADGVIELNTWSTEMQRELGPLSQAELDALYTSSLELYHALLADTARTQSATPRKGKTKSPAAAGARQKVNKAQRTAQSILDSLSRRYSDPPIFAEGQRKVNAMRELYKERVKTGMAEAEFVAKAKELGANEGTSGILWEASKLEIEAREVIAREKEREKLYQLALQDKSLAKVLDALRKKLYPGMKWADIFMELPSAQKARQIEIYKRLMKDKRLVALAPHERLLLTNELDKAWQRERRKVFMRELEKAGVMGETKAKDREKVKAAAPRLLRLMNLGMLNSDLFREALAKEYGLGVIDAATGAELRKLGERIQQAPEGLPRRKLEVEMLERLQRLTKSTMMQVMDSWWTASVLSGWRTQVDIGLSILNGIEDVGLGSVVSALRTGNKDVALRSLGALFGRIPSAFMEAVNHVATGNKTLIRNFELEAKQALESGNRLASDVGMELWNRGGWRKVPGGFMIFYGRLMTALDHLNAASTMQGAKMMALARHPELYQKAIKISPADRAAALAQAKLEMLGGAEPATQSERLEVAARQREILDQETPVEVLNEATEIGRRAALQGDPTGLGGGLIDAINSAVGTMSRKAETMAKRPGLDPAAKQTLALLQGIAPVMRAITGTKFARTAAHALNRTTSYVPGLGIYTVGQQGRTGAFGDILAARQVIGTLVGLALYLAFDDDDDERGIEDGWKDKTPQEKAQLYAQGKQPFTVWERTDSGRVVSFNYQQWGVAGIVNTVAAMLRQKNSEQGTLNVLMSSLTQGMMSFTDKAQLQGLQTVLVENSRSTDPASGIAANLNKWAAQTVGGLVPRLVKDIDMVASPELRSNSEWWQKWAKEVPMLRQLSSGKRIDILGENVQLDRGPLSRVVQIGTADPDYRLLARLNERDLYLPDPTQGVRVVKLADGTRRTMTEAEKDRYQRATGKAYRQYLRENGANLLQMEPEKAKEAISARTKRLRDIAAYQATH